MRPHGTEMAGWPVRSNGADSSVSPIVGSALVTESIVGAVVRVAGSASRSAWPKSASAALRLYALAVAEARPLLDDRQSKVVEHAIEIARTAIVPDDDDEE